MGLTYSGEKGAREKERHRPRKEKKKRNLAPPPAFDGGGSLNGEVLCAIFSKKGEEKKTFIRGWGGKKMLKKKNSP